MKLTKAQVGALASEIQKKIKARIKEQKEAFLLSEEYRQKYNTLLQEKEEYRIADDVFTSYPSIKSLNFGQGFYNNINRDTIENEITSKFNIHHSTQVIEGKIILASIDPSVDVETLINTIVDQFTTL